jgi:hypothetical protein
VPVWCGGYPHQTGQGQPDDHVVDLLLGGAGRHVAHDGRQVPGAIQQRGERFDVRAGQRGDPALGDQVGGLADDDLGAQVPPEPDPLPQVDRRHGRVDRRHRRGHGVAQSAVSTVQ